MYSKHTYNYCRIEEINSGMKKKKEKREKEK